MSKVEVGKKDHGTHHKSVRRKKSMTCSRCFTKKLLKEEVILNYMSKLWIKFRINTTQSSMWYNMFLFTCNVKVNFYLISLSHFRTSFRKSTGISKIFRCQTFFYPFMSKQRSYCNPTE